MDGLVTTPTRVPAGLWDSLQEICWRQDIRFMEDAARILGVSAVEIKRRLLGTRGVLCGVISTGAGGCAYDGTQCPIMVLHPGERWERCSEAAEVNGFCWLHRKGKGQRYDSCFFEGFEKRHPFRFEGEIVWVAEDSSVLTGGGKILKDVRIDITNGVAHDRRPPPPPSSKTKTNCEEDKENMVGAKHADTPLDD
jgi:hypothetical protein